MGATTRQLVDEIVYARTLLALEIEELRSMEAELRRNLGDLLSRCATSPAEKKAMCMDALERAWARGANALSYNEDAELLEEIASIKLDEK